MLRSRSLCAGPFSLRPRRKQVSPSSTPESPLTSICEVEQPRKRHNSGSELLENLDGAQCAARFLPQTSIDESDRNSADGESDPEAAGEIFPMEAVQQESGPKTDQSPRYLSLQTYDLLKTFKAYDSTGMQTFCETWNNDYPDTSRRSRPIPIPSRKSQHSDV